MFIGRLTVMEHVLGIGLPNIAEQGNVTYLKSLAYCSKAEKGARALYLFTPVMPARFASIIVSTVIDSFK